MTKERMHISIDKNLLAIAKKNIPNLSKFFTECLESWLEYTDKNGEEKGEELRKEWEKMNMAKVKIQLLLNDNYYEENIEIKIKNKENSDAWLTTWRKYRKGITPDERDLQETMKKLNLTEDELEDILWDAYQDFKGEKRYEADLFDNWEYIKKNYKEANQ